MNESSTVSSVVKFAKRAPGVTEVIVVDGGSIDGTAEMAAKAGANVITSTLLGKGASMEDGMRAAKNEIILFLDGDLSKTPDNLVQVMTKPLIKGKADFVKARFTRSAGRVTMLTARPLLMTFFPELAKFEQPLGGFLAARHSLLSNFQFETDYGVDVGLLLDLTVSGANFEQVDVGHIEHNSNSLETLGDMAKQVVRVILDRAARYGRLDLKQLREVEEVERHSQAELSMILQNIGQSKRLALFDMDGTLLKDRFVVNLAKRTNKLTQLNELLDNSTLAPSQRTRRISKLFIGTPKLVFEEVARDVPLTPGAVDVVVTLRKFGYRVGIVSDSFRVATEIVRRRVFADFSIAHLTRFRRGIATGEVTLSPAMRHKNGCKQHNLCKHNVLLHLCKQLNLSPKRVLAVGDSDPDACMLKTAGVSVAFQPKSKTLGVLANHVVNDSLLEVLAYLGRNGE